MMDRDFFVDQNCWPAFFILLILSILVKFIFLIRRSNFVQKPLNPAECGFDLFV